MPEELRSYALTLVGSSGEQGPESPQEEVPQLQGDSGSPSALTAFGRTHTSCKACCFAVYDGKTQTGCQLGRTEKFGDAVVKAYDEELEFDVIKGRVCNAYRDKRSEWATKHAADHVAAVKDEIRLRLAVVVLLDDPGLHKKAAPILDSLKSQSLAPHEVYFVTADKEMAPVWHAMLWAELGNAFTWRMVTALDGHPVDAAANSVKSCSHYAVAQVGDNLPKDFISQLDEAVNEHLDNSCVLRPERPGRPIVVRVAFHRHPLVGGYAVVETPDGRQLNDLAEKAAIISPDIVKPISSVLPCFRTSEATL